MAKHTTQAPVLAMTRVTDTVWQLRAGWDGPVRAGQFFMLRGWQGKDPLLGRPSASTTGARIGWTSCLKCGARAPAC